MFENKIFRKLKNVKSKSEALDSIPLRVRVYLAKSMLMLENKQEKNHLMRRKKC